MNRPEEKEYYINTGCGMEVVRIADWYEVDNEKEPTKVAYWMLSLSLMSYMHGGYISWRQRFRHIWRIIMKGTPWQDEVIFGLKEAKEFRDRINEMVDRAEKELSNGKC